RGQPGAPAVARPARGADRLHGTDRRHGVRAAPAGRDADPGSAAGARRGSVQGGLMSRADALLATMWVGLTLYALLAGADFGGGFWDLFAGGARRGLAQRTLIEHSIGPVWEA